MLVTLTTLMTVGFTDRAPIPVQELQCITMNEQNPATRPSPLDSVTFTVGSASVKVCYGRPSSKGRTMIGGEAVPFGQLWRTGANEPTMLHTSGSLSVAGIEIGPGSYSLYTVPDEHGWQVVLNRSITQWGHERYYTGDVAAQEIGRAKVQAKGMGAHVETFTIRADGSGSAVTLILEWENTLVEVPIQQG